MGIAAYNRTNAAFLEQFRRELDQTRATNDARAALWAKAITAGAVLHFKIPSGGVLTLGPYQEAVGPQRYAAILRSREGRATANQWFTGGEFIDRGARSVALWAVERIGRSRPFQIGGF